MGTMTREQLIGKRTCGGCELSTRVAMIRPIPRRPLNYRVPDLILPPTARALLRVFPISFGGSLRRIPLLPPRLDVRLKDISPMVCCDDDNHDAFLIRPRTVGKRIHWYTNAWKIAFVKSLVTAGVDRTRTKYIVILFVIGLGANDGRTYNPRVYNAPVHHNCIRYAPGRFLIHVHNVIRNGILKCFASSSFVFQHFAIELNVQRIFRSTELNCVRRRYGVSNCTNVKSNSERP
jgi:hypothetical protein